MSLPAVSPTDPFLVPTASGPIHAVAQPPGSKSLTNRALVCAALASGNSVLSGALDSEDTRVMLEAWQTVGVPAHFDPATAIISMEGGGGRVVHRGTADAPVPIFINNSGTSIRFLTAALAAVGGFYRLSGVPRMHQRPIGDLGKALRTLGANVSCQQEAYPPVSIASDGLIGGTVVVPANLSSQFLSGLLMAAPLAQQPVELRVEGELVSEPYVEMTCQVMQAFGVEVQRQERVFTVEPQRYLGQPYEIEPDASAASYFWAAAAITQGDVTVTGLHRGSLQGDVGFVECLRQMGCQVEYLPNSIRVQGGPLVGIDINMADISDTVQTLAAVALFATGTTRVHGVAHNRLKETDRIEDLATELRRLGATVETYPDGLSITPGKLRPTLVETYNDHRMAMSLALVGLRQPGTEIKNPACTAKTYPLYFRDLLAMYRD